MCAVNEKKQVQLCVAKLIGLRFLSIAIVSSLFFLNFCGFLVGSYLLLSLSASLEQGLTVRVCRHLEICFCYNFSVIFVYYFFIKGFWLGVVLMLFF